VKKRVRKKKRTGAPSVRLPLPRGSEKRHGDATKFDRKRERERLRKELDAETRGRGDTEIR